MSNDRTLSSKPIDELREAARAMLRFRAGNDGRDGWIAFEGSDNEWDEMKTAAWDRLALAVRATPETTEQAEYTTSDADLTELLNLTALMHSGRANMDVGIAWFDALGKVECRLSTPLKANAVQPHTYATRGECHICAGQPGDAIHAVQLCAPHGKDWLTCPECAKAAVKGSKQA
ncbi:MAG: hypothetical protein JWN63_3426 [Candidatus Acidoferrum typicum]|nr:hypothetical protein [Candidatus Acidoferrum typicum]